MSTTLSWTGGFACVRWFHTPTYLNSFLVVKIHDRFSFDETLPSLIDICDIDPSRVMIEICGGDNSMFVMRIEGYDTCELSEKLCGNH